MNVEEIEAKRKARKAAVEAKRAEQYAIDLAALDDAEVEHGDSNVARIDVPFTEGLPTMALARTPKEPEVKRYRSRVVGGTPEAPAEAAEELVPLVLVYPAAEVFARMCAARPGLKVQVGVAAIGLAMGRAQAEGKG